MDRAAKQAEVTNLKDKFGRSTAFFVTDYKGMNVEQVTSVRKALSSLKDTDMRVVKNTLARRAAADQSYSALLNEKLVGTNALIFSYGDPARTAKALVKFVADFEHLVLKMGVLKGTVMTEAQVKSLADLPSREVLLSKLLGSLNAPAQNFVGTLAAIPRSVVNVLNAVKVKKESGN